jgi:hypothetical protein
MTRTHDGFVNKFRVVHIELNLGFIPPCKAFVEREWYTIEQYNEYKRKYYSTGAILWSELEAKKIASEYASEVNVQDFRMKSEVIAQYGEAEQR